jgi:hypothetical protein
MMTASATAGCVLQGSPSSFAFQPSVCGLAASSSNPAAWLTITLGIATALGLEPISIAAGM